MLSKKFALALVVLAISAQLMVVVTRLVAADTDTDRDGLTDVSETTVYGTNPYNWDTDGDNYSDGVEVQYGTNPLNPAAPYPACCGGGPI